MRLQATGKMANLREFIETRGLAQPPEPGELDAILAKYPWFTTVRILRSEIMDRTDPLLDMHFISHSRRVKCRPVAADSVDTDAAVEIDMIESFLQRGEHRVVPRDDTPEHDAAESSAMLDVSDDLVSEELAEIYRAQGLIREARQIYEQLSLLYPEKSIYFAQIIGEMESGTR